MCLLERRLFAPAQDDVVVEPERPFGRGARPFDTREISRLRSRSSRTELKIGSYANNESSGKYICVTSRWVNARPNSEKWMWAGRQALKWFSQGYGPGWIVMKR